MIGRSFTEFDNQILGEGGYGRVIKVRDEYGKFFASKRIQADGDGIPCLMETSVMSTIQHPYINTALTINSAPGHIDIVQPLAESDLVNYIRDVGIPSDDQLRIWTFQLVQAVACLHYADLIHCDIKGHNVLFFPAEQKIRLSDFTLTRKKNWGGYSMVGTSTHRAIEVWLNRPWGTSIDMWSLGCTLYEIATGRLLIPVQTAEDFNDERKQYINALLDWGNHIGDVISVEQKNIAYRSPNLLEIESNLNQRDPQFTNLLRSLLRLDPNRPDPFQLIQTHRYFSGMNITVQGSLKIYSVPEPTPAQVEEWTRWIPKRTEAPYDKEICRHSIFLMARAYLIIKSIPVKDLFLGCYWISCKLVVGSPPTQLKNYQILMIETLICTKLNFQLS